MVVAVRSLQLVFLMTCLGCDHFIDCRAIGQAETDGNTSVISDHSRDLLSREANPPYYVVHDPVDSACGRTWVPLENLRRGENDQDDYDEDINDDPHLDKILGGTVATYGEFPWMVNVQYDRMRHCGGAIISEFWVVSAAHCYCCDYVHEKFRVIVGDHSLLRKDWKQVTYKVSKIAYPVEYKREIKQWDIALLKIQPDKRGRGIQFNDYVQPVCLPEIDADPPPKTMFVFTGWGDTDASHAGRRPQVLMKTYLPMISNKLCVTLFQNVKSPYHFCAGYVNGNNDLCQGDSGGPVVYKPRANWIVFGVASYSSGCGGRNYPGVFTNLPYYRRWIDITIRLLSKGTEGKLPSRE